MSKFSGIFAIQHAGILSCSRFSYPLGFKKLFTFIVIINQAVTKISLSIDKNSCLICWKWTQSFEHTVMQCTEMIGCKNLFLWRFDTIAITGYTQDIFRSSFWERYMFPCPSRHAPSDANLCDGIQCPVYVFLGVIFISRTSEVVLWF